MCFYLIFLKGGAFKKGCCRLILLKESFFLLPVLHLAAAVVKIDCDRLHPLKKQSILSLRKHCSCSPDIVISIFKLLRDKLPALYGKTVMWLELFPCWLI